jgi:TolB-like protein
MTGRAALAATLLALGSGCGYHLVSKGSSLPPHVKVIAVLPFTNSTSRPELGERVTEDVVSQLVDRGKWKVTSETRGADAVLSGSVTSWTSRPVELSESTSQARRVAVTLRASVSFEDRVEKRILWSQDSYSFTSEYEVIGDPEAYFDTELGAVEELAEDFSRALVSALLQGF